MRVKALARRAGFDLVGITSAQPFERERAAISERIRAGLFNGLAWFTQERADVSSNPCALLAEARSIIALAISYGAGDGPQGLIARYAWGSDYHDVIRERLKVLVDTLNLEFGAFEQRIFVDTGRMVDRAAAVRAGLGWYGKNTNVLNSRLGSFVFLAELVTTLELEPDKPTRQSCGECSRCLPACPTGAITAPYVVNNDRCISFLTIELKGPIPREMRPLIGGYIFGCDLCQDVCPVTRQAQPVSHAEFAWTRGEFDIPVLTAMLSLDDAAFRERFRGTPLFRPKRSGLLRNVAVALGNSGDRRAVPALIMTLNDTEVLVRGHAAWALGQLGGPEAETALRRASDTETDPYVLEEITLAITAR